MFKRWWADPSAVCPPQGEELSAAQGRLKDAFERITRKHGDQNLALVLGPLALGIVRCLVESAELTDVRSMVPDRPLRYHMVHAGEGGGYEAAS